MNNPKVSVIIPTYNRANLIENTINGVINQTFIDWELLVIDDGSTDNTKEIVEKLAIRDNRIKYFYQEASGGPSSPRNLGVEKAKGEYVAFLDSDDEWFHTKLEKQLDLFENSNNPKLGVVACYLYIKNYQTGKIVSKHDRLYRGNVLDKIIDTKLNLFTASCIMTKLFILKEVGPFDIKMSRSEDTDMWLRVSEKGYDFDYVPEYLLNYLIHNSNIYYGKKDFEGINDFVIYIKKHYELYLKHEAPDLGNYYLIIKDYKKARSYLYRNLFNNVYSSRDKVRILGQIIITYYPPAEKIWKNIKKIFGK